MGLPKTKSQKPKAKNKKKISPTKKEAWAHTFLLTNQRDTHSIFVRSCPTGNGKKYLRTLSEHFVGVFSGREKVREFKFCFFKETLSYLVGLQSSPSAVFSPAGVFSAPSKPYMRLSFREPT